MDFTATKLSAEKWISESGSNLTLFAADETESRFDFHVPNTNVSFYIIFSPGDERKWHIWSDEETVLPSLQSAVERMESSQDKTVENVLKQTYLCIKPHVTDADSDKDEDDFQDCDEGDEDGLDDDYYAENDNDALDDKEEKTQESDDNEDDNFFGAQGSPAAVQRLTKDLRTMQKADSNFGIVGQPRGDNLFIWDVKLIDLPDDSKLGRDLLQYSKKYNQEAVIKLEMQFPSDYPFSPPFLRVLRPRFKFLTGHVTIGGSICMEMLTKSGWRPTNDIESILVQVRAEIMSDPNASLDTVNPNREYTEHEAKDAFNRMVSRYGWDK